MYLGSRRMSKDEVGFGACERASFQLLKCTLLVHKLAHVCAYVLNLVFA